MIFFCLDKVFEVDNRRKKAWMKISQLVKEARTNHVEIEDELLVLEDLEQFQLDLNLDLKKKIFSHGLSTKNWVMRQRWSAMVIKMSTLFFEEGIIF